MTRYIFLFFCIFATSPAMAWDVQKANIDEATGKGEFFLCSVSNVDVRQLLALDHSQVEPVTLCARCYEDDPGIAVFNLSTISAPAKDYSMKYFDVSVYADGKVAEAVPLKFAVFPTHVDSLSLEAGTSVKDTNPPNTVKILNMLRKAQRSLTLDFSDSQLAFNANHANTATQEFVSNCPLKLP